LAETTKPSLRGSFSHWCSQPKDGSKDVFVHATAVERAGIPPLNDGQKISYEIETDERSGKSAAANLQLV